MNEQGGLIKDHQPICEKEGEEFIVVHEASHPAFISPIIDIKGYKEVVFIEREAPITLNWQEQYEEAREANRCTTNTNGS